MLFLGADDIIGKKCFDLWEQDKCGTDFCPLKNILSGVREYEYEVSFRNSTGGDIIVQINAVPYYSSSGEVAGMIQNVIDITEKRDIQRKLITIIDDERKMISHDLHDGLGQNLTAIGFLVESIRQKTNDRRDPETMKLEEIGNLVQISQSQTRTLSKMLSPVEMEQTGFMSSLEALAANVEKVYGITCAVLSTGDMEIRDNYAATHLYYIVREAVNNAMKHGRPKNIIIRINKHDSYLVITVKDDGKGIGNMITEDGMGLKIMKHRAEIIGASFSAGSYIDGGFAVVVKVPV
jgi:signal transduction histidine kinase